jgi:hypothetical protein
MRRNYQRLVAASVVALVVLALCAPLASAGGSDWDSDGIRNASDNCMKQANPTQTDLDGDGQGDVCDPDRDGDGQLDAVDPCPDDALDGCVAPPPPPLPDTTPPETTIDSNPAALTNSTSASFDFSSNESGSTFQCKLDGGAFESCSSPKTVPNEGVLAEGTHTFSVKATDGADNTDATPATYTWTVDTTPPETTITDGPAEGSTTTLASASFSFSSSEANSTFSCQLDAGGFSACTSPKTYNSLANGSHTFDVKATDAARNTDATPARLTWTVNATTQSDPVFVGAGDIASCSSSGDEATANLLDGIAGTVYTLGDNAYDNGTADEFKNCYHPSWGRHQARTKPSVGNHEYNTLGASGYYNYFGAAAGDPSKGYYSYDLGAWHIVALNSMCENVGGCGDTSDPSKMVGWLKQDLATHPSTCTLAYWHHPVFSSGSEHGNDPKMVPSWNALYDAGADVVLSGHDHDYERFAPQTSSGAPDPARGIREFVVGTGGRSHYSFGTIRANSEVRNSDTFGVLKLTLHPTSYDWKFVPEAGKTFSDSGTSNCH